MSSSQFPSFVSWRAEETVFAATEDQWQLPFSCCATGKSAASPTRKSAEEKRLGANQAFSFSFCHFMRFLHFFCISGEVPLVHDPFNELFVDSFFISFRPRQ